MRTSFQKVGVLSLLAGLCVLTQGSTAMGQLIARRNPQPPAKPPTQLERPVLDKIEISADPKATGDTRKLQQEIALQFSRQSFYPRERKREYAWIAPRPADGRMGLWLSGWSGTFEEVTKTSDGLLVRVAVWPCFANGGHASRMIENGLYMEEYKFVDGHLHFQQAIAPRNPGRPLAVTW